MCNTLHAHNDSWAVCGMPDKKNGPSDVQMESESGVPQAGLQQLSNEEKVDLGAKCKELIDVGRALYLQERGFNVTLVRYVDPQTSPENTLLLATRR